MSQPRLLDLFCGVGGAAVGYHRAGFDVVGVDIKPQPNYPFEFVQADALEYVREHGSEFDAIHASPPCQAYSSHVVSDGRWSHGVHDGFNTPRLIEPLRALLQELQVPYVIENVMGARWALRDPMRLCGAMFQLAIPRHRLFESNFPLVEPEHLPCKSMTHPVAEAWIAIDPDRRNRRIYSVVGKGRQTGTVAVWQALMDMPWAKRDFEMAEAIPPAYTEYVGKQLMTICEWE